jgi:superfamily II DNA helicase RecQ
MTRTMIKGQVYSFNFYCNCLKYFSGFTLVISPMVSLMEDQIIQMQKLNVNAQMISSYSSKEETKLLFQVPLHFF